MPATVKPNSISTSIWTVTVWARAANTPSVENSFVKLEYRYSNYSEGEIDLEGDLPDSDRFDTDLDRHQIVAGVGFRF